MNKTFSFREIILFILTLTLVSCQMSTPSAQVAQDNDIQNIRVQMAEPVKTTADVEQFPLPNCGGTDKLVQSLGSYGAINRNVTIGVKATVKGGGEAGISEVTRLKLEAQVELAYQKAYDAANSRLDSIEMTASTGTHVIYTIIWEKQVFSSMVQYSVDDQVYEVPYIYELRVPKIDNSGQVTCPDSSSGNLNTPTSQPLILETTVPKNREAKGVKMAFIPAGEFQMGSEDGDNDEKPAHMVYLDAFYIDVYEVTNASYSECVQAGGCTPPDDLSSYTRSSYYGNVEYANYPVVNVTWVQAQAYCTWRGDGFRLPTEAEWEKAARGGLVGKHYPWGDERPNCARANYWYSDDKGCVGDTSLVGSYEPNGYGLYDMAGNVWEWVGDWYLADYYSSLAQWRNPFGPAAGWYRVARGGAWDGSIGHLRTTFRLRRSPSGNDSFLGFRLSRSP